MKNTLYTVFRALTGIVLIAKIFNWFLKFPHPVNQFLNIAMFSLIGIAYLVMGYVWNNKFEKMVILICGIFLISMNLFPDNIFLSIIGIICILTPMTIARFSKEKERHAEPIEF